MRGGGTVGRRLSGAELPREHAGLFSSMSPEAYARALVSYRRTIIANDRLGPVHISRALHFLETYFGDSSGRQYDAGAAKGFRETREFYERLVREGAQS